MMTAIDVRDIVRIDRDEAKTLALNEFELFGEACAALTPEQWTLQTDCDWWDVRKMVLHVLGAADAQASIRQFVYQFARGYFLSKKIDAKHFVDGMNEIQIREREHLTNDEIVRQLAAVGPKAVKGRWRTPPPMRRLPIYFSPELGWRPLSYLLDVGFTRDVWAHRIDLAAATGEKMALTAEHDGRLVADIVAEWAGLYGHAFTLELEGVAGATFTQGDGGDHVTIDAVDFIRVLSGRLPGTGVLSHPLPL